ncbi:caspase, EACC1-associated type [Streptomyces sp. NBC_00063]|uniref:caspase family protein n=1 Tax=Streptomyces sp. NBC_00063 TaxID=2975638 RepID=UPI003D7508F4
MVFPDPRESRAVLIGVSTYTSLPGIPTARNNVEALSEILTSLGSWNLPSQHCTTIHNPKTPEELVDPILQCAEEATDTLLVYYAGHGLKGANRGEFRLSRSTSRAGAPHTSTDYDDIRETLLGSTANRRIVILDCCYAASALGTMADPAQSIADDALIEGTYLIAAAGETQAAISEDGGGFTVFTGELVRLLREGVPDVHKKFLDLDTVFTHLHRSLRAKARPLPHKRVRNSPERLTLSLNKQWVGWVNPAHDSVAQTLPTPITLHGAIESATILSGRSGGWPTATSSGTTPSTTEETAPAAAATPKPRPGAWPTAAPSGTTPSTTEETAPAEQTLLRQLFAPRESLSPTLQETVGTPEPSRAAWPKVRQPPQKSMPADPQEAKDLWQRILKSLKNRRRFSWLVLDQNVEDVRLQNQVIQIRFKNESSLELYRSSGTDHLLASIISEEFTFLQRVEEIGPEQAPPTDKIRQKRSPEPLPDKWPRKAEATAATLEASTPDRLPGAWPTEAGPAYLDGLPKKVDPRHHSEAPNDLEKLQEQWPTVLAEVKARRRFAWIILDQNARLSGFDGETLQLSFANDSAKQHYQSAGIDAVLEQSLHFLFKATWKIDTVTDG